MDLFLLEASSQPFDMLAIARVWVVTLCKRFSVLPNT